MLVGYPLVPALDDGDADVFVHITRGNHLDGFDNLKSFEHCHCQSMISMCHDYNGCILSHGTTSHRDIEARYQAVGSFA